MDKEQARLILRSFRPDGADAADPDFAEALHLAAADRELGEWLARERAQDAEFSHALARVKIPENLREEILFGLAAERGEVPVPHDELDRAFIAALSEVHPPEELRAEILAAMSPGKVVKGPFPWFRLALPLAAAAGFALAILGHNGKEAPAQARITQVRVEAIQTSFFKTVEAPDFSLEHESTSHEALFTYLKERGLPCPACDPIPPGLQKIPSFGCRELVIEGKSGSLICFDLGKDGEAHLIMFQRKDVSDEVPVGGKPQFNQSGEWSVASWGTADDVFVLVGDITVEQLAALF
jgi:hypothetical protein